MRSTSRWLAVMVTVAAVLAGTSASAQIIGTFRWQLAPHCNLLTLTVDQRPAGFSLEGFDDMCGAPKRAGATGTAHLNPDGTIGLSVTVVRPDGLTIATSASVNLSTISGTWSDEYANAGPFVFDPATTQGTPRPLTLTGNFAISFTAAGATAAGISAISFGKTLETSPKPIIVPLNSPPTVDCPGTAVAPRALPGILCVYEGVLVNVDPATRFVVNRFGGGGADTSGAAVYVRSAAQGDVRYHGRWAVTVP